MAVRSVDPATLHQWLADANAVLVDVREPVEHRTSRIAGAKLKPLSSVNAPTCRRPARSSSTARKADAATRPCLVADDDRPQGGARYHAALSRLQSDSRDCIVFYGCDAIANGG